ncbi:MAG: hypothetical protein ACKOQY_07680, partial [Bacteroidota bacterium]
DYQWSGGATPTAQSNSISSSGTYSVTVTFAGGCTASASRTVTIYPTPQVSASASPSGICPGGSSSLSSSVAYNDAASAPTLTILSENFNAATNNWTAINNSTGGTTPAAAAWTLRPNNYQYLQTDNATTNFSSNDASQFYLSNSDAQATTSTGVITATVLQSPAFSTQGLTSCNLNFFHFFRAVPSGDTARVQVSTNGTTWTTLATYIATQGTSTAFANPTISLAGYLNQPSVFVRFKYDASWDWYWAIDNVSITGTYAAGSLSWISSPSGFNSTVQNPGNVSPSSTTIYTLTAINNYGCTASDTAQLVVNSNPTVSASSTGVSCIGGSNGTATANPTGTAPFTYSWSNATSSATANNLSVGSYTVTVTDANGCSASTSTTVSNLNTAMNLSATSTKDCPGGSGDGSINLSVSGGTAPYSYSWSNGSTSEDPSGLATGNYTVTVTDNLGCTASTTVFVDVHPQPSASISAGGTTTFCQGGSVVLTANNGSSYSWSSGQNTQSITVSANGSFTVDVTDANGCVATSAATTVTVNALPTATITTDASTCTSVT